MAEVFVVTITEPGGASVELRFAQQNPALALVPLVMAANPRPSVTIDVEETT